MKKTLIFLAVLALLASVSIAQTVQYSVTNFAPVRKDSGAVDTTGWYPAYWNMVTLAVANYVDTLTDPCKHVIYVDYRYIFNLTSSTRDTIVRTVALNTISTDSIENQVYSYGILGTTTSGLYGGAKHFRIRTSSSRYKQYFRKLLYFYR